jgi:hypothetical protein
MMDDQSGRGVRTAGVVFRLTGNRDAEAGAVCLVEVNRERGLQLALPSGDCQFRTDVTLKKEAMFFGCVAKNPKFCVVVSLPGTGTSRGVNDQSCTLLVPNPLNNALASRPPSNHVSM